MGYNVHQPRSSRILVMILSGIIWRGGGLHHGLAIWGECCCSGLDMELQVQKPGQKQCMHKSQKAISPAFGNIRLLYFIKREGQVSEMSAMVTKCGTHTPRWFCESLWKICEYRRGILTSPLALGETSKCISCSLHI